MPFFGCYTSGDRITNGLFNLISSSIGSYRLKHEGILAVSIFRNSCGYIACGLDIVFRRVFSRLENPDRHFHGVSGRARLYWTLFGGNHYFFRGKEEAEASKPKLSIEYDQDDVNNFASALSEIDRSGKKIREFKQLSIRVKNTGRGVAHNCTSRLVFKKWNTSGFVPATNTMRLTWSGPSHKIDIGVGSDEYCIVVFADFSFDNSANDNDLHALVATMDSRYPKTLNFLRAQDGLGVGEYEAEIIVRSEEGATVTAVFKIRVTKHWRELSMSRIS